MRPGDPGPDRLQLRGRSPDLTISFTRIMPAWYRPSGASGAKPPLAVLGLVACRLSESARSMADVLSSGTAMPHLTTDDGIRLYFEETGAGTPIVFVHEFADDYRGYEGQLRYFGRRYRCIAYNARGY